MPKLKPQVIFDLYSPASLKHLGIGACTKIGRLKLADLKDKQIIYTACTPQTRGYNGFHKKTIRAYIWNAETQKIELLFSNTTVHRAKIALNHYEDYLAGKIDKEVWHNYVTNGHQTMGGLFRSYSKKRKEIMALMRKSHEQCTPNGDSKNNHQMRQHSSLLGV